MDAAGKIKLFIPPSFGTAFFIHRVEGEKNMFFNLGEANHTKDSEILLQLIDEVTSFIKDKGGDSKLTNHFYTKQIAFVDNTFLFNLNVSIPLRK
jgi:hypothetical protein